MGRGPSTLRRVSAPNEALRALTELLRDEGTVISPYVDEPVDHEPVLGALTAAGERARGHEAEYALIVEAVREGYLLHYGTARVVAGADEDLALLAGDYLYALGLDRLTRLGDLTAVHELSDLISLAAQIHDGGRDPERAREDANALWLAVATAVGSGSTDAHTDAVAALRVGSPAAGRMLAACAAAAAASGGYGEELGRAAERIDFPIPS